MRHIKDTSLIIKSINGAVSSFGNKSVQLGCKQQFQNEINAQGIYTEWHFDNNILTLKSDRYGFYPCYYYEKKNEFGISTSIDMLLQHIEPTLDEAAIAVFLRLGYFLNNDTPFKEIRSLPAGANLTWSASEGSIWQNQPAEKSKPTELSYAAAVDFFGEVFQHAVNKYQVIEQSNMALPLSGGRDSRHILFALLHAGIKPQTCLTIRHQAPRPDEDARIASILCNELNLSSIILDQEQRYIDAELAKNKLTNFCSIEHSWLLPLREHLLNHTYSALFDGIGGDVMSNPAFTNKHQLKLIAIGDYEALADSILSPDHYLLACYLNKPFQTKFSREKAIHSIVENLKPHIDSPSPLTQFFFWNRTRRTITQSPWRILNTGIPIYAPFLDHDAYNFLASLPIEYVLNTGFHTEAISRFYPHCSHLAYEDKSASKKQVDPYAHFKNAFRLLTYFINNIPTNSAVNHKYLVPRLLKSAFTLPDSQYLEDLILRPIWLSQLEKLLQD